MDSNPTGTGVTDISDTVNLPAGSSIVYTVTGTLTLPIGAITNTISNTAAVTPPGGTPQTATDTDKVVNLTITKSDNAGGSSITIENDDPTGNVTPGQTLIYTVVVTNSGPGSLTGATITDPIPSDITGDTWTAASTGSATATGFATSGSGNIDQTGVNLPADSQITYTITGTVISTATGSFSNTATVAPPNGTPQTATDTDNVVDLSITKSDNAGGSSPSTVGNVTPGQTLVYTVVVNNTGPGSLTGATITDPIPADITGDTWTAASTGGNPASGFATSGAGNIDQTGVNLPADSQITYTITGTVISTATGSFSNTATVTPPVGNSQTATDTDNVVHLTITKLDDAGGSSITPSTGNVTPGQTLVYTVVVSNTGPGSLTGATITDPIPADITGAAWTAASTGSATASGFATSGAGNIDQTGVNLPANSQITYTVTGTVNPTATGTFTNTATVAPPLGNSQTATDPDNLVHLTITKVDNVGGSSVTPSTGNATPGQALVYTVVVSNTGPGSLTGATITDPIPSDVTGATWTAASTGGVAATGFATSGSGNIDQTGVGLPANSQITYTITGTVNPTATGTFSNTATVAPPVGTSQTATDNDNLISMSITKVDDAGGSSITNTTGNVVPGQTLIYTIVVSNAGPGNAIGATIIDPIPSDITSDSFTATQMGGASGFTASGTGIIDDFGVDMPAGSSITYVITGTVSSTATGTLSNTATVTPPGGTSIAATDNDNLPDLTITKTDDAGGSSVTSTAGNVANGQTLVYTITISNSGPGSASGVSVSDPLPSEFTSGSYTTMLSGGAMDSNPSGSGVTTITDTVTLPAGSSIVYTVTGTVDIPTDTNLPINSISNTVSETPPGGTTMTATDNDNVINLGITKTDNSINSSVIAGQSLTYTVVVTNSGAGNAAGVTIADPMPANFISDTWTATSTTAPPATGFSTSGSGNINDTDVTMPPGSSITYTISGTVSSMAANGSMLVNTATATPAGGTPVSATDTDTVGTPDLTVVKSDTAGGSSPSTVGNVIPGQALTYVLLVTNQGTAAATGVTIADPMPSNFTGATWSATSTGTPPASGFSAFGSSNIDDTNVTLPPESTITYIITGRVNATAVGQLTNTATITPTVGSPVSATDTDNLSGLEIIKSDDVGGTSNLQTGTSSPAGVVGSTAEDDSVTYTVVVSNVGPGFVNGAAITDTFPAGYAESSWTAVESGGATGATLSNSTAGTNIDDTVDLPSGSSITYTISGTMVGFGTVSNTASVTPSIGTGISATDTDNVAQEIPGIVPVKGISTVALAVADSNTSKAPTSSGANTLHAAAVDAALTSHHPGAQPHQSSESEPASTLINAALGGRSSAKTPSTSNLAALTDLAFLNLQEPLFHPFI